MIGKFRQKKKTLREKEQQTFVMYEGGNDRQNTQIRVKKANW